jgi:hypothetical protein
MTWDVNTTGMGGKMKIACKILIGQGMGSPGVTLMK